MPLIRLDESALQILDNLALNTARQRSSSNHKRSLKPRDCHVAIGYWATRRNTWRHPQVASTAALQKRRSIKDLPLPGVLPLVPLVPLPPYSPELNPVERIWEYLRDRWLSHRVLAGGYDAVVDAACAAWNALLAEPGRLRSLTNFPWLPASVTTS